MGKAQRRPGLGLGLTVLAVTTGIVTALVFAIPVRPPAASTPPAQAATRSLEQALPDAASRRWLQTLAQVDPALSQTLHREGEALIASGAPSSDLTALLLSAQRRAFADHALRLRTASVADYDALFAHLAGGLTDLKASGSDWCQASRLKTLFREDADAVVPVLLSEFNANADAYRWFMDWSVLYLRAVAKAQAAPVQHFPRTLTDELILQDRGRALGTERWALALAIATFSQAEGTGYRQMQEVVETINTCDLGLAMIELSGRLPDDVRGRIMAELLPEVFSGNAAYALWLLNDYFFIG